MGHNIFISYRRSTGSLMATLVHHELVHKYPVFLDVEQLSAGNFQVGIYEEMKSCDTFILILSKDALDRCENPDDNVRLEILAAKRYGLAIIPVMTEDFVWPEKMPAGLEDLKFYNAIPYVQVYGDSFFERLYSFIEGTNSHAAREKRLAGGRMDALASGEKRDRETIKSQGQNPVKNVGAESGSLQKKGRGGVIGITAAVLFVLAFLGFYLGRPPLPKPSKEEVSYEKQTEREPTTEGEQSSAAPAGQESPEMAEQESLGSAQLEGFEAVEEEDFSLASLQEKAEAGDAASQYELGKLYYTGTMVELDYEQSAKWFTLSAERGHAGGQERLGLSYLFGRGVEQSYEEALHYVSLSAGQGNADAQCDLGWMYEHGVCTEQNYEEAFRYYSLSAEQGQPQGQFNLGNMYFNGWGVPSDLAEAVKWYTLSAEGGSVNATVTLGALYEEGLGVEKDQNQAEEYYEKAKEMGWEGKE